MIDLNKLKAVQVAHWDLDVADLPERLIYRLKVPDSIEIADSEGGEPLQIIVLVAATDEGDSVSHLGYGLVYEDDEFYCQGSLSIKDPLDIPTADGIIEDLLLAVQETDGEADEDDEEEDGNYQTASDAVYKLFQQNQMHEAFRLLTETLRENLV